MNDEKSPTREGRLKQLRAELEAMPRDTLAVGTLDYVKIERSLKRERLLLEIWELEEPQ